MGTTVERLSKDARRQIRARVSERSPVKWLLCVLRYTCKCVHTHMHTHACAHMHTHVHMCLFTRICMCIHMYTLTHKHMKKVHLLSGHDRYQVNFYCQVDVLFGRSGFVLRLSFFFKKKKSHLFLMYVSRCACPDVRHDHAGT